MASKGLGILVLTTLAVFALIGCGGGSGSTTSNDAKSVARKRMIATTRVARNIFAMAGFAQRVSRAPSANTTHRIQMLLAALQRRRDVQRGKDADTGLYYALTINADGSGRQDLFTDAAYHSPAGFFSWPAPQWANNKPNTYPAVFHVTFQITAGEFAGTHGTMDVTLKDSTGKNSLIHLILKDVQNDNCVADLNSADGMSTAQDQVILDDGTTYTEDDKPADNGDMVCTVTFSDGWDETMTMNPDGTGNENITDSSGTSEATGDFQDNGTDTINYDDGSSETVNVDTQPE